MRLDLPVGESRHQFGEPQQISDPEKRTTLPDHDLRIRRNNVGPLPRHRADAIVVGAQQEPRPVPVVAFTDADELPATERVERVRHAHKARPCIRKTCSSH